jgi:hypothetical protein
VASLVILVNLCLRPLTRLIQAQTTATAEASGRCTLTVVCRSEGRSAIFCA